MRILVLGAGVVGSVYAAHLHEAGKDVTVLARGGRLNYIRENGIVLEETGGEGRTVTGIPVIEELEMENSYGLVLVAVRRDQIEGVMESLAPHWNTPNIAFLMSNVAGPDELTRDLGRERVLMGFPSMGGIRKGNSVHYIADNGRRGKGLTITIGELDGRISPRIERITNTFEDTVITVEVVPYIDAWLKNYFAHVLPLAFAIYRSDGNTNALAKDKKTLNLITKASREGIQALKKLRVPITPPKNLPLLDSNLNKWLSHETAEVSIVGHINAARDEFTQLAQDFRTLIQKSSIKTPAIDELLAEVEIELPLPEKHA